MGKGRYSGKITKVIIEVGQDLHVPICSFVPTGSHLDKSADISEPDVVAISDVCLRIGSYFKTLQAVNAAQAVFSSGCRLVYFVIPTMVKTFWKWGVRPKVWIAWPRLFAAIIIWITRAMPLELRYSTLEKSR